VESCAVMLDGDPLTVAVEYERAGSLRFLDCRATYRGTVAACRMIWFAVSGGAPRHAAIPTVRPGQPHTSVQFLGIGQRRRVEEPHIEVADDALRAIRRRYPLDNFFEADWMALIGAVSGGVAAGIAATAFLATTGLPHRSPTGWWRLGSLLARTTVATYSFALAFCLAYGALVLLATRRGLVD
jgi:hypothetical protein